MISFRDLLAPGLIAKVDETHGSVPLFSASQCHPSQSLMGRETSISGGSDKENVQTVIVSRTEATPLPKRKLAAPFMAKARRDQHFPTIHHEMTSTPLAVSPMHEPVFYTPAQSFLRMHGATSPSVYETTYRSLPKIEMLGLDFIQQCQDPSTLQEIVKVLSTVPGTPSLLRTAERRYTSLCTTAAVTNQTHALILPSSTCPTSGHVASVSPPQGSATHGQPQSDSSLYFSIDSEVDDCGEEQKENTNEQKSTPTGFHPQSIPKSDFFPRVLRLNESDIHAETKHDLSKPEYQLRRDLLDSSALSDASPLNRLQSEVERLTQQIKNLETNQWHMQQDFAEQIDSLEIDRRQMDQRLTTVQERVKDSVDSKHEILKKIEMVQTEQKRLNKVFHQQRLDRLRRNQELTVPQNPAHTHVQAPSADAVDPSHGNIKLSNKVPISQSSASVLKTPKSALKKVSVSSAGAAAVSTNKRVTLKTPLISSNEEEPEKIYTPKSPTLRGLYSPQASSIKRHSSTTSENNSANEASSSGGASCKEALILKRQIIQRSGGLKVLKEHYKRARSPRKAASPRLPLKALA